MIKIDFVEPRTAEWQEWRRRCQIATSELISAYDREESTTVNDRLYKGQKSDVYITEDNLPPFHGKCAYCEQTITGDQHGDIDHYRPKGRVTDAANQIVCVMVNGRHRVHPGYYWLAYDWKNLLPACGLCNRESNTKGGKRIGKGSRFPVAGAYASAPGEEVHERPVLLHPCFDDPDEHLEVDDTGLLIGTTDRGRMTVRLLGLNQRNLPEGRKKQMEVVQLLCERLASDIAFGRRNQMAVSVRRLIEEVRNGRSEFAMAGRRIIREMREAWADPG